MYHKIQITLFVDNLTDGAAQMSGDYLVHEGLDTLLGIEVSKSSYVRVSRIDERPSGDETIEHETLLGYYTPAITEGA